MKSRSELEQEIEELRWLVQRAKAIRRADNWTKQERERSWADWDTRATNALRSKTIPCDQGLFADRTQMDLQDRKDI